MVERLISHPNVQFIADILRGKILGHPLLGDPRLPANRNNWLGIDPDTKKQFIRWLSQRDIVFFFDHVLKGRDRHGRREFWLHYVERMVSSRPLLSEKTAFQFRNDNEINFGKLSSSANQAAFILDFGETVVIEFSDIGKIYIYKRVEFEKHVKDMWIDWHISENSLRDQFLPEDRKIVHRDISKIVNYDWREKARTTLAMEGIRP
jgi:hypothetical protein